MGIIPIFHHNVKKRGGNRERFAVPTGITIQLNLTGQGSVEFQSSVAAVRGYLAQKPPLLHPIRLRGWGRTQL